jgi:hypothetical protein
MKAPMMAPAARFCKDVLVISCSVYGWFSRFLVCEQFAGRVRVSREDTCFYCACKGTITNFCLISRMPDAEKGRGGEGVHDSQ